DGRHLGDYRRPVAHATLVRSHGTLGSYEGRVGHCPPRIAQMAAVLGMVSVRMPTFFSSSTYSPPTSMTSTLPARSIAMRVAGSGTLRKTRRLKWGVARQCFSTAS